MVNKHLVESKFTKPYFTLGDFTKETEEVWFIFHGYGQLVEYFGKYFNEVISNKTYLIFPQAPARLYIDYNFDRVGASWITKVDTEEEIQNNFNYLDSILQRENIDLKKVKINGFGFSQGVSMLVRWFAHKQFSVEKLVFWAGKSPISHIDENKIPLPKKLYFVMGENDPLKEHLNLEVELPRLEKQFNIKPKFITYKGGHKLDKIIIGSLL